MEIIFYEQKMISRKFWGKDLIQDGIYFSYKGCEFFGNVDKRGTTLFLQENKR